MTLNVYCIMDIKADGYGTPFFMLRDGMALRAFTDLVNDRNTTVSRHPDDYKLVCIGEYDDVSGRLMPLDQFRSLGFASDFVQKAADLVKIA